MNPGRYFMPNMVMNPMMIRSGYNATRGMGLFGRLTRGFRSFNWSKLLNGANRTLNVMNQTIPLIRQAKPMVGNVKNMLHLAKAFRNETNNSSATRNSNKLSANNKQTSNIINNATISDIRKKNINDYTSDMPTFFI